MIIILQKIIFLKSIYVTESYNFLYLFLSGGHFLTSGYFLSGGNFFISGELVELDKFYFNKKIL